MSCLRDPPAGNGSPAALGENLRMGKTVEIAGSALCGLYRRRNEVPSTGGRRNE
jgi:hypothetical protein